MKFSRIFLSFAALIMFFTPPPHSVIYADENNNYDPKNTALALNIAIASVQRIINTQDRIILDQEYNNIINNLKFGNIEADDEIITLYQDLLNLISGKILSRHASERLRKNYDQWEKLEIQNAVDSINFGMEDVTELANPVKMSFKIAEACVTPYFLYQKNLTNLRREIQKDLWQIEDDEQKNYNGMQIKLLSSSWRLLRKYNLPDEFRITQKLLNEFFSAVNEKENLKSFSMLSSLENEFKIYPPYWIYRAKAAQKLENLNETQKCFDEFEKVWRPVLRIDPYMLEFAKYKVLENLKSGDKTKALEYLEILKKNTDRSDWANNLFSGITFFILGEKDKGINLIKQNINFNIGTDISNLMLEKMKTGKLNEDTVLHGLNNLNLSDITKLSYEELKELATYGKPEAQNLMGLAHHNGMIIINVPQSNEDAINWLKKSAYSNYKPAQKNLGDLYFSGAKNFKKDYKQAYIWYYVYGARSISEQEGFFKRLWQRIKFNLPLGGISDNFGDPYDEPEYNLNILEGEGIFNFARLSDEEIEQAKTEANKIISEIGSSSGSQGDINLNWGSLLMLIIAIIIVIILLRFFLRRNRYY